MIGSSSVPVSSSAPTWLSITRSLELGERHDEPNNRSEAEIPHRFIDSTIRQSSPHRKTTKNDEGLEWALIDTREGDPGEYLIRGWTDACGVPRPVEFPPRPRHGGAIAMFTLRDRCVSIGPCPSIVDEGAGLLLLGFVNMMSLPLPARGAEALGANWLLILSHRVDAFSDSEIDHLLLVIWAIFEDSTLSDVDARTPASDQYPVPPLERCSA